MKINNIYYYTSEAMGDWSQLIVKEQFERLRDFAGFTDKDTVRIGHIQQIEKILNPIGISMEFIYIFNKITYFKGMLNANSISGKPTIGYSLIYKGQRSISIPIKRFVPQKKAMFKSEGNIAVQFLCGDLCNDVPEHYVDDFFTFRANSLGGFINHINIFLNRIKQREITIIYKQTLKIEGKIN